MIDGNLRFSICPEVAIEELTDVYLVFLAGQLRLLEINRTTKRILDELAQGYRVREVAGILSSEFDRDGAGMYGEISTLVKELVSEGVLCTRARLLKNGEKIMSKTPKFMANPDVSCRVEDEDGAILFNPDSNSVQIINPVGLEIWTFLKKLPRTIDESAAHILTLCADAPPDEVKGDVEGFIKNLHSKGFIGEVVDE